MLQRYNRYPLIIDPSGVATEFLTNTYADQKIVTTSFLDSAFMKSLESAMRFGTPIIIQDVENIDPVLNTVLNKEVHKTGGRSLVSLGDQDIDFSPAFKLFLVTRDPTFNFTPDLCSRVTFVNFTITPSSLQNQCLNKVLKIEQPEVDKRRSDLLKLQGEFKVRLRELEDLLLNTLNEAEGDILSDDKVITTLETLKRESAEVTAKAAQTSATMEEVEQTSNMYLPLALSCSRIYFAMESLADIHFFYQFSLKYFLQIFNDTIMGNRNLDGITDSNERLEILSQDLYNATFLRVCRGMQNQDTVTFALRLAQIRLTNTARDLDEVEVNALLVGATVVGQKLLTLPDSFNKDQTEQVSFLSSLEAFSFLQKSVDTEPESWAQFLTHATPEKVFPNGILTDTQQPRVMWQRMLLIKAVRPDRFLAVASEFVAVVMGSNFLHRPALDLAATVAQESDKTAPLLLCSMPGYDASSQVDQLAQSLNKKIKSIALGSPEGYELAEKAVTAAANSGSWVLLKNIHLAPEWLMVLEKQLHRLNKHNDFRLFFTMEMNPCVPRNVIRISQTFVFEPPAGIKSSLKRSFGTIPPERLEAAPAERPRVYLLLAWFNAVVQERKRYCPVGWTKRYEFSDNDLKHGLDTVDYWVNVAAAGRSNIAPEKIPWAALHQILCHVIYGGRVDNMFDTKSLASFIEQYFTPDAYNQDYSLVKGESVTLPDSNKYADIQNWINSLPDDQPPTWLGLSSNAELMLSINHGKKVIKELQQIQQVVDVDDEDDLGDRANEDEDNAQPAWLRSLTPSVESWIKMLPKEVLQIEATSENLSNPIARFLDRETSFALQLHQVIQCHLNEVLALCNGTKSPQAIRDIALDLSKGLVPDSWRKYASMDFSMSTWFPNLLKRLEQLSNLRDNIDKVASIGVWLGGLFSPEAFVTATRQATAQRHKWALEQLELDVCLGSDLQEEDCFTICALNLENASLRGSAICASDDVSTVIPKTVFRWVQQGQTGVSKVSLPVYLNSSRKNLLLTIGVEVEDPQTAYNRGIAVVASI
jgi:dynein heavy chain 1